MKELFRLRSKYHGKGPVTFAWQPDGGHLATAGINGLVHVFDRHGAEVDDVALTNKNRVLQLEWNPDGQTLAILQQGTGIILLWMIHNCTSFHMDTGLNDPTFMKWSSSGKKLVIGTQKGNLLTYNPSTRKKTPILGKHPRAITCGDWNSEDKLALGSDDGTLTISDSEGATLKQVQLKTSPQSVKFSQKRLGSNARTRGSAAETIVVINMKKSVMLYDMEDPDNPVELEFNSRYGEIVDIQLLDEGLIAMGFIKGFIVVASTHPDELGEERHSARFFSERIVTMCYSRELNRLTLFGNGGIKVINMMNYTEIKEDGIQISDEEGTEAYKIDYTPDSQIITVSTKHGVVQNFLARMLNIHDHFDTYIAYLSSLREVSVVDALERDRTIRIAVSIEPSFIALGPHHVAVGMNNRVWYYRCDGKEDSLVNEQEYLSTVTSVKLNSKYAAVMCDGRVTLHAIEGSSERENKLFPEHDETTEIKTMALTRDFLIYGTEAGNIDYFYIKDWAMLSGSAFRHDEAILQVFPNPKGNRVIFVDARRQTYMYNPVTSNIIHIPGISSSLQLIMWDAVDRGVFAAADSTEFGVFIYQPLTVHGEQVTQLGVLSVEESGEYISAPQNTKVPFSHSAVIMHDGFVTCQQDSGSISKVLSCAHDSLDFRRGNAEKRRAAFTQNLALLRLQEAWKLATKIDARELYLALAGKAMEVMDIEMSIRVYRHLGDAGMVIALERLLYVEDKNLLAGEILTLFGDYDGAQELLLTSSDPTSALRMRRDLLHWDQALRLAGTLAPHEIPELAASYGQQLEFKGNHERALKMYEQACREIEDRGVALENDEKLKDTCLAGVARTSLRLGDIRRGRKVVLDLNDPELCKECGAILEASKQLSDAAAIYEAGKHYDKAAALYIQIKDIAKAANLIKHVTAPKIHGQFARSREAVGEYKAAVTSYEIAQDLDSVVRIYLDQLNDPEKAFSIVRSSKSAEGALAVAKHCTGSANYRGAIEFLLMANKSDQAFELAQTHNEMGTFTQTLGESISSDQALNVAQYYEKTQDWAKAGEFYQICGNYHKALKLFLQCGEKELDRAVEVTGRARNDMLTHMLIDYLMGETDGAPKDPNYIFRLYMALGNFKQAAKTATIIARQEQDLGNYKVAHGILYETHSKLVQNGETVPQALGRALMLLHSYLLVKKLVKQGDHPGAARMLVRVANNVSKFPTHVVNILTSTVIECQRANLKPWAYEFAVKLMRPENRTAVEAKFKRKIEQIVRRPCKDEIDEEESPCPHCNSMLPITQLDCSNCKNWVSYCIVTGQHMTRSDWATCPSCEFPALHSHFVTYLDTTPECPMCAADVKSSQVIKVSGKKLTLSSENQREEEQPQVE